MLRELGDVTREEGEATRESQGKRSLSKSQTKEGQSGSRRKWTQQAIGGLQGSGKVARSSKREQVSVGIGIS